MLFGDFQERRDSNVQHRVRESVVSIPTNSNLIYLIVYITFYSAITRHDVSYLQHWKTYMYSGCMMGKCLLTHVDHTCLELY